MLAKLLGRGATFRHFSSNSHSCSSESNKVFPDTCIDSLMLLSIAVAIKVANFRKICEATSDSKNNLLSLNNELTWFRIPLDDRQLRELDFVFGCLKI